MSEQKKKTVRKSTKIEAHDIKCRVAIMHFEGDLSDVVGTVAELFADILRPKPERTDSDAQ